MMKLTLQTLIVTSALAASSASAQFTLGMSAGRSDLDPNRTDWSAPGLGTTFDDKSSAWRIFGGYQINKNVGIEIGYANLGDYIATITSAVPADTGRATVEVNSWQLFLTGSAPLGPKFGVHGKLGVARNESKMDFSSAGAAFLLSDRGSKTKTSFAWGVGASYSLNKSVALRVDYESFGKSGNSTNNFTAPGRSSESDPTLLSVGVQFSF